MNSKGQLCFLIKKFFPYNNRLRIFSILEKMEDNAVAVVANDPQIINFYINCFQSIDVKTMPWLSPTFCTDNLQKLVACEQKPLTEDEKLEEKIVLQSLNFLSRIFRNVKLLSSKQVQLVCNFNLPHRLNSFFLLFLSENYGGVDYSEFWCTLDCKILHEIAEDSMGYGKFIIENHDIENNNRIRRN